MRKIIFDSIMACFCHECTNFFTNLNLRLNLQLQLSLNLRLIWAWI